MPELPEVETVRRGLQPALEGARLTRVQANRSDLRFPLPENFVRRLTGARIERLGRRGKYLTAALDSGETLAMHLGMSGRFTIIGAERQAERFHYAPAVDAAHTHVVFETEAGARVEYNDPRRFGYMTLMETVGLEMHPLFVGMGPEPLGNEFGAATLAAAFARRKQNVKATLLDQRVVAGLGNIYVCEALHCAAVSPRRAAGRVTGAGREALSAAIRAVLEAAIEAGGSSLKDYAQADGALGYFQHRFAVYDREGAACPRAGCGGVVRRIVQAGRSTFFCPRCQH
ncbi:MAG: bifunctional DNA-formamidopyrimidine glycosylase/DNA-(apurinic or apyrimidinic site) lyase [Hyphomonadaceae bacterium]